MLYLPFTWRCDDLHQVYHLPVTTIPAPLSAVMSGTDFYHRIPDDSRRFARFSLSGTQSTATQELPGLLVRISRMISKAHKISQLVTAAYDSA
jgi:hypothetical protein